jgi:uncharacterized repeat protein (TIGR03803 family)
MTPKSTQKQAKQGLLSVMLGMVGTVVLLCPSVLRAQLNPESSNQTPSSCSGSQCRRPRISGRQMQTLVHFYQRLGSHPKTGLVQASDGLFYGTTYDGGRYNQGTLFRLSAQGQLTTLVHFSGQNGAHPLAELIQASDGNLYGTTHQGGQRDQGTLFRLTPSGELTTLVHFYGQKGTYPSGALVEGADQVLYGTTQKGGNFNRCAQGCGTVFSVSLKGSLLPRLEFNKLNGAAPLSGLMIDHDGKLWGTTARGGENDMGVVFRLDPKGGFKKMVTFNVSNGARPVGRLVQGKDKNLYLYGVTRTGGDNGQGTLFRLLPSGQFAPLYHFNGSNGANPDGGLILGSDGFLYGTTANGAPNQPGVVFQISAQGQFRVLKSFHQNDGANPRGSLVQGQDGLLYGTTELGGQYNQGTVFRVKPS